MSARRTGLFLAMPLVGAVEACTGGAVRLPENSSYVIHLDDGSGWRVHELRVGVGTKREIAARIVPQAGANVHSLTVNGVELLRQPPAIEELPGYLYGMPVLYPTPSRVENATFTFEERVFRLPANAGRHHIHGLVNDLSWESGELEIEEDALRFPVRLDVREGHPLYERFPFDHRIELTYTLSRRGLTVDLRIRNRDTRRLPFGFGIQPCFRIPGDRGGIRIVVPSLRRMEADPLDRLPSGRLEVLNGSSKDLREAVSLEGLELDEVYWGVDPDAPAVVEALDSGVRVRLRASVIFSHSAVVSPAGADWLSVGYQTCSSDAHNLYARGATDEAHLLILEPAGSPGSTVEGRLSFEVELFPPAGGPRDRAVVP